MKRALVIAAAAASLVVASAGCESIFGIGDLPHGVATGGDGGGGDDGSTSGDAGACTPVTVAAVPSAGAAACGGTATCSPGDVRSYPTTVIPPVKRTGVCSNAQVDAYFRDCIDPTTGDKTACQTWTGGTVNQGCYGCLLTPATATAYGAAVIIPNTSSYQVNVAGCIALAEPCNEPCAKAFLAQTLCAYASCDPNVNCAGVATADLTACFDEATKAPGATVCACQGYAAAAKCVESLTGPASLHCIGGATLDLYKKVAAFMCGPL